MPPFKRPPASSLLVSVLSASALVASAACSSAPIEPFVCTEDVAWDMKNSSPLRLRVEDGAILDDQGAEVRLRGANLKGIDAEEASDLKKNLKMNFARLRVSFESPNRDDDDPTGFSKKFRGELDGWVRALEAEGVWILIEMRGDDGLTNDPNLYDPSSDEYRLYERAWGYLACRYRTADRIAGYGLLAEPSASRGDDEPVDTLTSFQLALIRSIESSSGDAATPLFVGPDFNYDTMQYRYDDYYEKLSAYRGRLVFEVNALLPKPWIQDGSVPDGVPFADGEYPQLPAPVDFSPLIQAKPGEKFEAPRDLERIFAARRVEPEHFRELLNVDFFRWYLGFAVDFAKKHKVPMVVDQFGASTSARGQLVFEGELVGLMEELGLHWSRWSYNAGSPDRMIRGNPDVDAFYRNLGASF